MIEQGRTAAGELFLVMELLSGGPLSALITEGPVESARVVAIGAQLADALAAAHKAGVVHRDLTPGNVFVRHDVGAAPDFVTILDFGLAQLTDSDTQSTNRGAGTTHYMSPEQILGERADARSDLYGLGLLLFELLAGRRPFPDNLGPLESLMQHVNEEPASLRVLAPATPTHLAELVHRLLAKDPADRPPDAATVRESLLAGVSGPASTPAPPRARHRLVQAVVVGVGLLALVAAGVSANPGPRSSAPTDSHGLDVPAPEVQDAPGPPLAPHPNASRRVEPEFTMDSRPRRGAEESAALSWHIVTRPSGARVAAGGVYLGLSPLWVSADLAPTKLRFSKRGYASRTVKFQSNESAPSFVKLHRDRQIPPTP